MVTATPSLDVYMARTPHGAVESAALQWLPYAAPAMGGGTLGVSGRF